MGDGTKENPYIREDVLMLIEENGGKAEGLDLSEKWFKNKVDLGSVHLEGADLREAHLEEAHLGFAHLEGARLKDAHLEGAELWETHLEGANLGSAHLEGANLRRAYLEGAQLVEANFENTFLRSAHLEGAYLIDTHFEGADLSLAHLEQTRVSGIRLSPETLLESTHWGNYILGEELDRHYDLASDGYRRLKVWYTQAGYHDIAAKFYYREKEANRKSLKWYSRHRFTLQFLRVLFGYGEGWKRVLVSIAVLILLFALTYCAIGSVWEWSAFWNSLYFSAVSFTALGYGSWLQMTNDIASDWIRGIGAFESVVGVSMMALLLVTFFRKWTR